MNVGQGACEVVGPATHKTPIVSPNSNVEIYISLSNEPQSASRTRGGGFLCHLAIKGRLA